MAKIVGNGEDNKPIRRYNEQRSVEREDNGLSKIKRQLQRLQKWSLVLHNELKSDQEKETHMEVCTSETGDV